MKRFGLHKASLFLSLLLGVFTLGGCGDAGNGHWDQQSANPAVGPTVTVTFPVNNATPVAIGSDLTATFNEAMAPATINETTFLLHQGTTTISGTVSYSGVTAVFNPDSDLANGTVYTATITTGATGLTGRHLATDYIWSFTTAAVVDVTPPTVTHTVPVPSAINVAISKAVTATFNEKMNPAFISNTSFTIVKTGVPPTTVDGNVILSADKLMAIFTPVSALELNTQYTATVTTAVKDEAGNSLVADYSWNFTTNSIVQPEITSTTPIDQATNVLISINSITATFNVDMDQATFDNTTFTVQKSGPPLDLVLVPGTVNYDVLTRTVTFAPNSPLAFNTSYTVTVTNGAKDLVGNPLIVPVVDPNLVANPWTFRTEAEVIIPPPLAINLGVAESFGIASRAGLTSTGVTVINGDVALSPTASCIDSTGGPGAAEQSCLVQPVYSSLTGMTVNGTIYWAADPFDSGVTAALVTTDLTTAWNEGMAKVNTQPAIAAGELGGKTFIPGVYENANLTLSAGGVAILDAQNDPNAIFIFKTTLGGDLIDSGTLLLPSRVDLANGAQARNVWFVIGRDITIGSGTTWNGNILANRTATVLDGSTVNGRVLGGAGGAGAITLTGAAAPSVTTISVPQ